MKVWELTENLNGSIKSIGVFFTNEEAWAERDRLDFAVNPTETDQYKVTMKQTKN